MNKKDCYNHGFNTGYDIAEENRSDYNLIDDASKDQFISDMITHESEVYRQYSPFEFFAHDININKYPDELWDVYDNGVFDGIMQLVKEEVNLIKGNHE